MNEYEFTLKFALSDSSVEPKVYLDRLYEAGCDDAVIGIGREGRIALTFSREAQSALQAIISAIENIRSVIPNAKLIEATPDFVGITDIANVLSCSRQNVRKLISHHFHTFPTPIHEGRQSLWHLVYVLAWFQREQSKRFDPSLVETAKAAMEINVTKESTFVGRDHSESIRPVFAVQG
jgi:hypothetical protein